jgi:uncharacterized membrane protein YdfJ with MMPL/SSD domain
MRHPPAQSTRLPSGSATDFRGRPLSRACLTWSLLPFAALVIGLALLLLLIVFRSVVVPVKAALGFSVFASFVSTPDATVKTIAFGLAFGVAVDAFIIRMTFVPAVLALLGRRSWWLPAWLGRILPSVDIEGTNVRESARDSRESLQAA